MDGQALKSIFSSTSLPFEKVAPASSRGEEPFPEGSVTFGVGFEEGQNPLLGAEDSSSSQPPYQAEPSSLSDGRWPRL